MEEQLIKKILPHSAEAEQSVIGAMIMDQEAILTASEILTSDDFYNPQFRTLYDAMLALYQEGKPVDLVTLQNRLQEMNVPAEVNPLQDKLMKIYANALWEKKFRYWISQKEQDFSQR